MKKVIRVATANKDSFDAIVALHNLQYTNKDEILGVSEDGTTIETKTYTFVKTSDSMSYADHYDRLGNDGATWFARMQSGEDSDGALWQMFVEQTAAYFHKNYSLLEYAPIRKQPSVSEIADDRQRLLNVLETFGKKKPTTEIQLRHSDDEDYDDIYSVMMRMSISVGPGEPQPILATLYFKPTKDMGLVPLPCEHAETIQQSLQFFDATQTQSASSGRFEMVSSLMNTLADLFDNNEGDRTLEKYLMLEDALDKKTIDRLIYDKSEETVAITCNTIDVLNVCRVKMYTKKYDILNNGAIAYNAVVGIGNALTITCALCKEPLVVNNRLVGSDIVINASQQLLGLTSAQLDQLTQPSNNVFRQHDIVISCTKLHDKQNCSRHVCLSHLFKIDKSLYNSNTANKADYLCLDCPYMEKVLPSKDKMYPSEQLTYCCDSGILLPNKEVKTCACCGRHFQSVNGFSLCTTCAKIDTPLSANQRYRNLYKRYKNLIQPIHRIFLPKAVKVCNEDETMIVFKLGKKVLTIDKMSIASQGYINKAVTTKRK